jgi:hypothetical protein
MLQPHPMVQIKTPWDESELCLAYNLHPLKTTITFSKDNHSV